MAKKFLNNMLDSHFDKVNSGKYCKFKVKKKKEGSIFYRMKKSICSFFSKVKEYFSPRDRFESADIANEKTTIVKHEHKGFRKHLLFFKKKVSFSKKKPKVEEVEPEDIDMSAVNAVIKNNKI